MNKIFSLAFTLVGALLADITTRSDWAIARETSGIGYLETSHNAVVTCTDSPEKKEAVCTAVCPDFAVQFYLSYAFEDHITETRPPEMVHYALTRMMGCSHRQAQTSG